MAHVSPVIVLGLASALAILAGCSNEGGTLDADSSTASRCAVLCEEELCGDDAPQCVDDCVVQAAGLDSLCVQCLIEDSYLETTLQLDDGRFCARSVNGKWVICQMNADCTFDDDGTCEADLPRSCELEFGRLDACAEFCM